MHALRALRQAAALLPRAAPALLPFSAPALPCVHAFSAATLLPPAAAALQRRRAASAEAPSSRRAILVTVDNNNVDKAVRRLRRRMIEEGVARELKERTHNQKPSELRVLAGKACEKRLAKRGLKIKLNWVLRKRMRGF